MNILLVAVNAKYIHSNPAIYALKSACSNAQVVTLAEYTINHQREKVLADIYMQHPDVVAFSCYIWNISFVEALVWDLTQVLPNTDIWLGGPEVSYDAGAVLERLPMVKGVMIGEGEETFNRLVKVYLKQEAIEEMEGILYRDNERIVFKERKQSPDFDKQPFYYARLPKEQFENRVVYYESSRGCPFSCSYCLSSIDKQVRFRSLALVKKELLFFLEQKVPQVKFIDRTFNCDKNRAKEIWRFLKEHANGVTNFHFEISADLLDEESIALLCSMPQGLVQLEIGVQTTNERVLEEIRRKTNLPKLFQAVQRLVASNRVHCHLDLIAGLPYEDYESFQRSFDQVYGLRPHQLQLGFLKVLKGSFMAEKAKDYGLQYSKTPPYEVLSTKWISYEQIILLKGVEEMLEVYSNSGQFFFSLPALMECFASPFACFLALSAYYKEKKLDSVSHSRIRRYEILRAFYEERCIPRFQKTEAENAFLLKEFTCLLVLDLYAREHVKSRPEWAGSLEKNKRQVRQFYQREGENYQYLHGYQDYDSQQLKRMTHLEPMEDGSAYLFDYRNRDAITYNARMVKIENWMETLESNEKKE